VAIYSQIIYVIFITKISISSSGAQSINSSMGLNRFGTKTIMFTTFSF